MPRFRSVSRTTNTVKLLIGDKMHIKQMVKEFKSTDERFKNETNAIRYFVHLGISAQQATENLQNSLDNTIVKNSIKEAVRKEISFHSAHIEKLQTITENLIKENEANFTEIARRTDAIEDLISAEGQTLLKTLNAGFLMSEDALRTNEHALQTSEHSLRNLIVLRSIFYVFLLGHRTGKIAPGEEDLIKWNKIIILAHEKANQLSLKEIKMVSADVLESTVIQQMANEIYKEIRALPKPNMS